MAQAMQSSLRQVHGVWNRLLDFVYPPHCLICERGGDTILCAKCFGTFTPVPGPVCTICGRPRESDQACRTCALAESLGGWGFDAARACGIYQGALREAIHKLKYDSESSLGRPLGEFMAIRCTAEEILDGLLPETGVVVVPLPIHKARRRERGFNQADLLAMPLADALSAPLVRNAVQKTTKTVQQVRLSGRERRGNVRSDMFAVTNPDILRGKTVVLVDDVFTTGATASACALSLKNAGAARVIVAALAAGG